MTDYWTQYCFGIALRDPDERAWAERLADHIRDADDRVPVAESDEFFAIWDDPEFAITSCEAAIESDTLYVESAESGVDTAIEIARLYLRTFDPEGVIAFQWADTASRARPDAYGGGAAIVRADSVETFTTVDWIAEKLSERTNV